MAKINSSRLLPQSKSSAIVPYQKPSITLRNKRTFVSGGIKPIKLERKSSAIVKKSTEENLNDIGGKLVKVEKFLGSDLTLYRKQQESKRKKEEKQDFQKAEEKLEAPKPKGFNFPKFPELPQSNFLDRIKRFIFFTALGRFLPAIIDFLPKLEGIVKTIGTIYGFAENIFGRLLDGFTSLVKFGGDLTKKTLGFITQAGLKPGQNFETEFNKLEKQFNLFVDASIIAGILSADVGLAAISEYKKWKGKNKPGGEPRRGSKPPVPRGKVPVTQGRGGQKPTGKPRVTGGKTPGWWDKLFKGPFAKLKGPLGRFSGAVVPGLGAVVGAADAKARFAAGDNIGGSLASISASLDVGTAGSALTGIGIPIAGVLGTISMGIDVALLIRDILRVFRVPDKLLGFANGGRVIRRYQGGGNTPTRGGQPVKAPPRRTLKVQESKKPFKVPLRQTKPGKDVGGEDKIKILYPEPKKPMSLQQWLSKDMAGSYPMYLESFDRSKEEKKPNPFGTLMEVSKELKPINVIGQLMGAGVDLALGQVPDKKIFTSFFDNVGYLADTWMNQRMNRNISLISREVGSFADGGYVSPSRELRGTDSNESFGEVLSKILGPMINQRINESIQHLKKEIQKKPDKEEGGPGGGADGMGGFAGGEYGGFSPSSGIQKQIYDYLINVKKLNDIQALGLMANISRESSFIPNNREPGGTGVGLFQWSHGRVAPFIRAVPDWETNWKAQIDYALSEPKFLSLVTPGEYQSKNFSSAQEAADWWMSEWERPKDTTSGSIKHQQYLRTVPRAPDGSTKFRAAEGSSPGEAMVTGGILPSDRSRLVLTSGQGWRWGKMHRGIDLVGGLNSPISSAQDAKVVWAGDKKDDYGKSVVLMYSNGAETRFAHLNSINVRRGQNIKAGQLIGREGSTGRSSGSHLHFEYYPRGGAMTYRGEGQALPVADKYFRYGGNVRPRLSPTTLDSANRQGNSQTNLPPPTRSLKQLQEQIGSMREGSSPINVPGVGRVTYTQNNQGTWVKTYYIGNKSVEASKFFEAFRRGGTQSPSQGRGSSSRSSAQVNAKQAGGLITPSKPTRPVPSSFASYENYGQGTLLAIQPIIIERTTPTYSSGTPNIIAFPVPVGVNNINDKLSFSRG